jgi:hypothetical protein
MNAYKPRTPPTAFALPAVTMAAITFGALVVLPAFVPYTADYFYYTDR